MCVRRRRSYSKELRLFCSRLSTIQPMPSRISESSRNMPRNPQRAQAAPIKSNPMTPDDGARDRPADDQQPELSAQVIFIAHAGDDRALNDAAHHPSRVSEAPGVAAPTRAG